MHHGISLRVDFLRSMPSFHSGVRESPLRGTASAVVCVVKQGSHRHLRIEGLISWSCASAAFTLAGWRLRASVWVHANYFRAAVVFDLDTC